ncbi:DUF6278 family protein [Streptomyces omiyaensis]|uniref:DUF6278 family protein n=1 Tax=Streptomyces omiyaensis TaxID=68247 RepID=A0ABW7C2B4_9ACTN|nr:DUF6278 family protein [Streptomyces omiyaensis]GGY39055.1 hypothetical protein GCM10010363_19870 [Streptomyces omiyaensis]
MNIPFLGHWRKRREPDPSPLADAFDRDPEGVAELLAECELLRARVEAAGVALDDTPRSLEELDQLPPRWRDDAEELPWFGNDAGLYLGTVIVRNVPGARWQLWPNGGPVVVLESGREIPVVEYGLEWAMTGAPELSRLYAEAAEA